MKSASRSLWNTTPAKQFVEVCVEIDDSLIMQNFFRDVMTEKEIIEISSRLEAARMLQSGATYVEIINKTKLSSRTIARINTWMKSGQGGYAAALKIIDGHDRHLPPARAE